MWTHFWDMSSGGSQQTEYHHIYIEADEEIACKVFYIRFGFNPNRISCTCCGSDYSIATEKYFTEVTRYQRNDWKDETMDRITPKVESVASFKKRDDVCIINKIQVSSVKVTIDNVPEEGWVWK